MHLYSAALLLVLPSLGASIAIPQRVNDNIMRRNPPYSVVNVAGEPNSSPPPPEPLTKTVIESVPQSPVTVTVTDTTTPTPLVISYAPGPQGFSMPRPNTPVLSTPASSTPTSSTPANNTPVSSTPTSSTPISSTPASSRLASSTPASSSLAVSSSVPYLPSSASLVPIGEFDVPQDSDSRQPARRAFWDTSSIPSCSFATSSIPSASASSSIAASATPVDSNGSSRKYSSSKARNLVG